MGILPATEAVTPLAIAVAAIDENYSKFDDKKDQAIVKNNGYKSDVTDEPELLLEGA
jgi:alanine racemase